MPKERVSARALAEFALKSGDLRGGMDALERMQEGSHGHRLRQAAYPAGFESEVAASLTRTYGEVTLTVFGRMDGLCLGAQPPVVEEIKTTRLPLSMIGADDIPAHWGQAELYAAMIAEKEALPRVEVRLTYRHVSGESKTFSRVLRRDALSARFDELATPYARWCALLSRRRAQAVPTIERLPFPYDEWREGQREMARQCYLAAVQGRRLLCQAPTGIGKTAAVLYAALKAFSEGLAHPIFYLTARGTTRLAAEDCLRRMRARGLQIHSISLTAKEKICPFPGVVCAPDTCPRAAGYFDRRREALREGLEIEALDETSVRELAAAHELCPFELELDLSQSCDVILCDYNYAFDPGVRLKRYFQTRSRAMLLVDEAHNLIDRARSMLSSKVRTADFRALARTLKDQPELPLTRAVAGVVRCLRGYEKTTPTPQFFEEAPRDLVEALEIFLEEARGYLSALGAGARLADRYFEAADFVRVAGRMDAGYRALYDFSDRAEKGVQLLCVDPSRHLADTWRRTRCAVLFSATLSPMHYYQTMLGVTPAEGDALLDLPSPFPPENLLPLILPLPVRFREREASAGRVAEAILAMCRAHRGNYLVCLPSYRYLRLIADTLRPQAGDLHLIEQRPGMGDAERGAFLNSFRPDPPVSMAALVVMGGVFSEGVDLPGDLLSGAAVITTAMPLLSFERYVVAQVFGEEGDGADYAYTYPGLERVLQAVGRVIRTAEDRGVALLIDERFAGENYAALLPGHWQPRLVRDGRRLTRLLDRFWREG